MHLISHEGNLKLNSHRAWAFDLPATETLPRGVCCSVCHQGIGKIKEGGEESDPAMSSFLITFVGATGLCAFASAGWTPMALRDMTLNPTRK